jgi:hypothetical protein
MRRPIVAENNRDATTRRDGKKKTVSVESSSNERKRHAEKRSCDARRKTAHAEKSNYEKRKLVELKKTVGRHCSAWRKRHV